MILKANQNGVSSQRMARALDDSVSGIRQNVNLLDDICQDAIDLLAAVRWISSPLILRKTGRGAPLNGKRTSLAGKGHTPKWAWRCRKLRSTAVPLPPTRRRALYRGILAALAGHRALSSDEGPTGASGTFSIGGDRNEAGMESRRRHMIDSGP